MKKLLLPVIIIALVFLITIYYYIDSNKIKSLNPPYLNPSANIVSDYINVSGTAYPNTEVLVFLNDSYIGKTRVNNEGNFDSRVTIKKEGENKVKVKNIYENIESGFSEEIVFQSDLTPPSAKSFSVKTKVPSVTRSKTIAIEGLSTPNTKVIIKGSSFNVGSNKKFSAKINLVEGNNVLNFVLQDEIGNTSPIVKKISIYCDTTKPVINNSFAESDSQTSESIDLSIGSWSGYLDAYNSVPIVGSVSGKVKSITVDGKRIVWDENKEIYQRMTLYIRGGLNKYKVVVVDKAGNKTTGYIETDAVKDGNSLDVNLYTF